MTPFHTLKISTLLSITLFLSSIAQANPPAWNIIPTESTLTFTATQNGAPVSGSFKTFTGDIYFDPAELQNSHVRIVVTLDSVTTPYKEVADTLKTADWFDVKLFPDAVFTATRFTKTTENNYQADGTLALRDKVVPLTLAFSFLDYSKARAHAKGSATLKRTEFGVGQGDWKKTESIKDEVRVDFVLAVKK